jgi:HD-GYP domain-containing protein (c-di-GMP phosphodiesterase class II)
MRSYDNPFLRLVRLVFIVGGGIVSGEALNAFRKDVPELGYFILLMWAITLSLPYFKLPVNITECLFFLTVIAFQPSAVIVFSIAITIVNSSAELRRDKLLFATRVAKSAISAGAAVLIYQSLPVVLQRLGASSPSYPMVVLNILVWMAWARFLINLEWTHVIEVIQSKNIKTELAKGEWFNRFIPYFASAVMANVICFAVGLKSEYTMMISLLVITIFYLAYTGFKQRYISIQQSAEEVSELHLRTIEVLASAIGAKDHCEKSNTQRIQVFAEGMGRVLRLSVPELKALRGGVALRDIGHLAVPDYILQKNEVLTEAEQEKIRLHPVISASILERIGFPYPLVPAVRHHHEHWDGTGYPDQLKGTEIPVTARILAIASAFEEIYCDSENPVARSLAIQMLLRESGRKFDRNIVELFLATLPDMETELDYLSGNKPSLIAQNHPELIPGTYLEAIRSARLEATELFEMAQTLSSTLNVEEAVSIIVSRLSRLVPCEAHALYLYDENAGAIYLRGAVGAHTERLDSERRIVDLVKKSLITGQPELCSAPPLNRFGKPIFSVVAVYPLARAGKNIGAFALCTTSEEGFSADHLRVASLVAPLAADALFDRCFDPAPEFSFSGKSFRTRSHPR